MSSIAIMQLDDVDIVIEEIIEFDNEKKDEYLNLFFQTIERGIIRNDINFDDLKWIIKVGGVDKSINFPNDIEIKGLSKLFGRSIQEFELAYKAFILFSINSSSAIRKFNLIMKKIAIQIEEVKLDTECIGKIQSFISFIKIPEENLKFFKKMFDDIEERECGKKILPEFKYIYIMADIINDIVENKGMLNYKDYLLIIIWWKVCSILPLRPSEFLRTKFNCIYEEENKFYLTVKRSKGKVGDRIKNISDVEDYYYEDIINIDEGLFRLISEYQDILQNEFNYKENEELFPFIILKNVCYRQHKNNTDRRYLNISTITSADLNLMLKKFYTNVVEKEYNLKPISKFIKKEKGIDYIERLQPYDLRHIAIINLVLLGTDVLEVMYLAGHKQVNTAYSYYSHVKEFSRGYALEYAKSIANKEKLKGSIVEVEDQQKIIDEKDRKEEATYILNTINGKKFIAKEVDGGYCHYTSIDTDKTLCLLYERRHVLCKYFVPRDKKILENEIQKVENRLDSDIKLIKDLISDMDGISKFNELYQTTSYRIAKEIQEMALLNKKLLMEKE